MNHLKTQSLLSSIEEQRIKNAPTLQIVEDKKGDDVDHINALKEEQLSLRLGERNQSFLLKLEKAQQKLEEGTYGVCDECDGDIGEARLLARPTACLCIGCQEEKEQGQFQSFKYRRDLAKLTKLTGTDDGKKKFESIKDIGFESVVDM